MMACRITMATGWTTSGRALACDAMLQAMSTRGCGTRTVDMDSAQ